MSRLWKIALASAVASASFVAFVACGTDTFSNVPDASGDSAHPLDGAGLSDAAPPDASPWLRCSDRPLSDGAHLCDDFDDPREAVGGKWNVRSSQPNALIDASPVAASLPNAFFSWIGVSSGTYAQIAHQPGISGGSRMRLAFSFRIDPLAFAGAAPSFDVLIFAAFGFNDAACDGGRRKRQLSLLVPKASGNLSGFARGFGGGCDEAGAQDYKTKPLGPTVDSMRGVWVAAALLVQRNADCAGAATSGASYHVALDGVERACFDLQIDPFADLSNMYVSLGLAGISITAPGWATFDNVEVDFD